MLIASDQDPKTGMVSPIIVEPREEDDFASKIDPNEKVCQAGHYPKIPRECTAPKLLNYWRSHFLNWTVAATVKFLDERKDCTPFSACFCASLWNSQLFCEIDLPNPKQFRTLNCAEIGYRAQLNGWKGAFAKEAFAFHGNPDIHAYLNTDAIQNREGPAWHYGHGQGLISLSYFPDEIRNRASFRDGQPIPWKYYFPELGDIGSVSEIAMRKAIFERWNEFNYSKIRSS